MGHRTLLWLLTSLVFALPLWASQVQSQTPDCVEPFRSSAKNPEKIKIVVDAVEFSVGDQLSEGQRAQITTSIQKLVLSKTPNEPDDSWLENLEVARDILQDQGYFRAFIEWTPHLIKAEASERHYAVTSQVELGPQYRLGSVRFENAKLFSKDELRKSILLQEGELFAASKIREGLAAIGNLYGGKGYIDMTPEPDFFIDAKANRIDLLLKIDEGKQYRIGSLEIFGANSELDGMLRSKFSPGQILDGTSFGKLLREDKDSPATHPLADNEVQVRRNTENGTVDLVVDFRNCSSISISAN